VAYDLAGVRADSQSQMTELTVKLVTV
jgi:hypothetical protein